MCLTTKSLPACRALLTVLGNLALWWLRGGGEVVCIQEVKLGSDLQLGFDKAVTISG